MPKRNLIKKVIFSFIEKNPTLSFNLSDITLLNLDYLPKESFTTLKSARFQKLQPIWHALCTHYNNIEIINIF